MGGKFHRKRKGTSFKDLSQLIVDAIESETFFNKETLIPRIKSIIAGFNLNINFTRFNAIKDPSETAKIIKAQLESDWEKKFWKNKLHNLVGDEKIKEYYKERDEERIKISLEPIGCK